MDPLMLMLLVLLGVMIVFAFINGRKRKKAMEKLRENMNPGVEVMLGSGIYATIVSVNETTQRARVRTGEAVIEVHTGAIAQLVSTTDAADVAADESFVAAAETGDQVAENNATETPNSANKP
ncbi:preprotein translocase subunit YajC [Canibacter sp. lx-72]|uniref:preprotein translocase subunit YajC n=1 Tax=Canibacter zhuwentaonis TaxID=2837491 RepID=UPI001BDD4405|nr:preprotein translocase subunit YajC [Canibacter zhuwentaonis]MBT1017888.1 preprotein translocase subunit YajC [Canibacter zhuwentaonis]